MKSTIFTLVLVLVARSRAIQPQAPASKTQLSHAAARYVADSLFPHSVIGLDTTGWARGAGSLASNGIDVKSIARELGAAAVGVMGDFLICAPRCDLKGADAVVGFGAPVIRGDSGYVRVEISRHLSGVRRPLYSTSGVLRFVNTDAHWTFVRYDVFRKT